MSMTRKQLEAQLISRGIYNFHIEERNGELGWQPVTSYVFTGSDGKPTNLGPWRKAEA